MRTLLILSCLLSTPLGAQTPAAQAPAPQPPATQTPPPATHPPARRHAAASAVTVTFTVSEPGGAPIGGVKVTSSMEGSDKDTMTTAGGIARFLSVKPGDYRVRFDRDNYVSLERDIVVKGTALDIPITLTPAPAAAAPQAPAPSAPVSAAPAGDARALSIVDFLESNRLNGHDPVRNDQLGCTASAKTSLIQVRDEMPEKEIGRAHV